MRAIITKAHGPTTHKGKRVSASFELGRVMCSYDYGTTTEEMEKIAVEKLLKKIKWNDPETGKIENWIKGCLDNDRSCWVYYPKHMR